MRLLNQLHTVLHVQQACSYITQCFSFSIDLLQDLADFSVHIARSLTRLVPSVLSPKCLLRKSDSATFAFHHFVQFSFTCFESRTKMTKIKTPWKATKMVKMQARAKRASTSITRNPMIQVMPNTTVRGREAFTQCLHYCVRAYVCVQMLNRKHET